MATIVLLEHALQRGVRVPYMVYALADRWRAQGHRVLVHHGTETPPAGDIAILNIDLTVVPGEYLPLLARFPRVVNARVLDISKPRFSSLMVTRDTDWDREVIVKTAANHGGKPEVLLRFYAQKAGLPCTVPAVAALREYPLFRHVRDVPDKVWNTPGLIVEKFVPESDERGYYLRVWSFFGDRETSTRYRSSHMLVKAGTVLEREEVEVPGEIRAWRERLGFDFGKFDYVRHGDTYHLLDVNRTPAFPPGLAAIAGANLDRLAAGLESFLR